jgi:phospholipid/cholesterol/gamma-HCH transport system permease protein
MLKLFISEVGYHLALLYYAAGSWHHWRKRAGDIVSQLEICAFGGFPVAMLVAVFTGMVLALQAGIQLKDYGQEASIGILVAASMCREMGPVMTGYILAGLIGSTIAAEIGTMKVSEEIDALEVMSIEPVQFLVMPRLIALAIVCPLLTIYTDLVGVIGGGVISKADLGVPYSLYFRNALESLANKDIYTGLFKAFTFGITIAIVGCAQGLRAENGAAGVGKATMKAVVISFVAVLILDFIWTYLFYGL